jgi:hypothetical protein
MYMYWPNNYFYYLFYVETKYFKKLVLLEPGFLGIMMCLSQRKKIQKL